MKLVINLDFYKIFRMHLMILPSLKFGY